METEPCEITVTFYSKRLLFTVDMNALVGYLLKESDSPIRIVIEEMSDDEKSSSSRAGDISTVDERFHVFVHSEGKRVRRRDLEDLAQHFGQK